MGLLNRLAVAALFALAASTVHAEDAAPALEAAGSDARITEAPEAPALPAVGPALALDDHGGDGRRTTGRFVSNLGRNLIGVVALPNLRPFLIGAAATGLSATLDGRTQGYFQDHHRADSLGNFGQRLGEPGVLTPIAATLFAAGRASHDQRFRSATYDIGQAFLVNAAWTGALKYAVGRQRPDGSNNLSFPSGHTSNAFAWATVADHYYGWKVAVPAYAAAGLVGVSRLEKNVHHLSDVVAGAALGVIVGKTVVRGDGEPLARGTRVSLQPAAPPSGTGVGLALSVQF